MHSKLISFADRHRRMVAEMDVSIKCGRPHNSRTFWVNANMENSVGILAMAKITAMRTDMRLSVAMLDH
jgi:hypothetical protein